MNSKLTEQEEADLKLRFGYHPPSSQDVADDHQFVRTMLYSITSEILKVIPSGRETSLFITKMEEAMMWANASIARNQKGKSENG